MYGAYIWYQRGIFVSGTYLKVMCEVHAVVSCILVDLLKDVGSLCT